MAERLSLELELLDKVGGPAKKAADALRGVETQAKKAQKALDFSSELSRTKAQLDKIKLDPKGFHDLIKAQKSLREEREKMKKSLGGHGGFFSSLKSGLKEHLGLEGLGGKLAKASFWGHLGASAVVGIGEGFLEGAHKAVEILYDGIKEAFAAIGHEQERRAGYDLTLGKERGTEAREAIEKFAPKTAFSASQNQDMMLPLFRAGLSGKAATTAYASALDLAAGRGKGSDSGAVGEAVETFARIQQKGGITTKQLSGIGLGETNVPAFFKDLGKQLHMSAAAAEKLAAKPGGIDPQILLNAVTDAINKQQGGQAGTGAERAGKSLLGQWNKLKSLPEEFFNKLADSPALPKLSKAIEGILEKLDPNGPVGAKIFAAIEDAFNKVASFIAETFTPENIDKFLVFLSQVPGYLKTAYDYGKLFAEIFIGGKLLGAIQSMVVGVTAMSAPVLAVGAAVIAVAVAFERIKSTIDELGGMEAVGRDLKDFFGGNEHAEARGNPAFAAYEEERRRNVSNALPRSSSVAVNGTTVNIHAAPGEDPVHTHQRAADNVVNFTISGLEKAAKAAGG